MIDAATNEPTAQKISKGAVILWEKFEFFASGEQKDSRFLILSDCHPQYKSFLAIRATTKTGFYEKPSGMIREFIIIPGKREKPLPEKSVIDLARIVTLDWTVIGPILGDKIKEIGSVSDELIKDIDRLVASSKTIRRDWKKWILNSPKQK